MLESRNPDKNLDVLSLSGLSAGGVGAGLSSGLLGVS